MSQGLAGTGVVLEVSDSPEKAEVKLLWRRALPAAARKRRWGSCCGCAHYCEIANSKRILNWGVLFVLLFPSSFLMLTALWVKTRSCCLPDI